MFLRLFFGAACAFILQNSLLPAQEAASFRAVSAELPEDSGPVISSGTHPETATLLSSYVEPLTRDRLFSNAATERFPSKKRGKQILYFVVQESVKEGKAGKALLKLRYPEKRSITFTVVARPSKLAKVTTELKIKSGKTECQFQFLTSNDTRVNLTRELDLHLYVDGRYLTSNTVLVRDDEKAPVMTMSIPAFFNEGGTPETAQIQLDRPAEVNFKISLITATSGQLKHPAQLTVKAGVTKVGFPIQAVDNPRIEGNAPATLTASALGLKTATARSYVVDNEKRELLLDLPEIAPEGGQVKAKVRIPGTLTTDLEVTLRSDTQDRISLPEKVTIPAGATEIGFVIDGLEDQIRDGSHRVEITATADTFTSASGSLTVRDNEPATYRFSPVPELVDATWPLVVTIKGIDIEGNEISRINGTIDVSLVLPDGSTPPALFAMVTRLGPSAWTAGIQFPLLQTSSLRLRAAGQGNAVGESNDFSLMRGLDLRASDLIHDKGRSRIYASLPYTTASTNPNGAVVVSHKVVAIDPATLAITHEVFVGREPTKLALTSGGEFLYVALDGDGTVSKIRLADFTIEKTFTIGIDAFSTRLYAEDLCTVKGNPDLLVVSQYRKNVSPHHAGVVVYQNGIVRPDRSPSSFGVHQIEPSSDPTLFYGSDGGSDIQRLKLGANGMTRVGIFRGVGLGSESDIRSDGDMVYSHRGMAVDGGRFVQVGKFPAQGLVCPDLASSRVYFLETSPPYYNQHVRISAYDANSHTLLKSLALPAPLDAAGSLIQFGSSGLAYRTPDRIVFINSGLLSPADAPADLEASISATSGPTYTNTPFTFEVRVTNRGPNPAFRASIGTRLSEGQSIVSVSSSLGQPVVTGSGVTLQIGELPAGKSETLTITATTQSLGPATCTSGVNSSAVDTTPANNLAAGQVMIGIRPETDVVNQLGFKTNNLLHDPTRNVLWASLLNTNDSLFANSVVSIDPVTGLVSTPLPISGTPADHSMAISGNGRFLYIGSQDSPEVIRIDLANPGLPHLRIPLNPSNAGQSAATARQIEVLDGDGTGFLVFASDTSVAVYDETTMRSRRMWIGVENIAKDASPGTYFGIGGGDHFRFEIKADGVVPISNQYFRIQGGRFASGGGLLLTGNGQLIDSGTLLTRSSLGYSGTPCLDPANQHAYLAGYLELRAYDTVSAKSVGSLKLPTSVYGTVKCLRWGNDGFAFIGGDQEIYIVRWSLLAQAGATASPVGIAASGSHSHVDSDHDGLTDALEYFLGTPPTSYSPNPFKLTNVSGNGGRTAHISFPRRAGLRIPDYQYQISHDLIHWRPTPPSSENIVSRETINGVEVENIEAEIRVPESEPGSFYIRLGWHPPAASE
ncbi:MAG: hypothetical protein V4584_18195 [Verrucomicrobiota bacterium]